MNTQLIERFTLMLSIFFLSLATTIVHAADVETVIINVSSTSGPAPLAVHFDVAKVIVNGQGLDAIRDVNYAWTFGDDNNERWATDQKSKNTDQGFVAAHIFEIPGSYQVSVEISSKHGTFEPLVKSLTIDVIAADEYYLGENTICFSMSGDFLECPDNAQQVQLTPTSAIDDLLSDGKFRGGVQKEQRIWNPYKEYALDYDHNSTFEYIDYDQDWDCSVEAENNKDVLIAKAQLAPFIASNKRLLFHRGESFSFYESIYLKNFNGSAIGAYGACTANSQGRCDNAPVLKMLGAQRYSDLLILADGSTEVSISDLAMTHTCGDANRAVNLYGSASKVTLNRLEIEKFDTAVIGRTYGQRVPHDVIGIFNSKFEKIGAGNAEVYDPENLECQSPALPNWHNGDRKTPVSASLWAERWSSYNTQMLVVLKNSHCKAGGISPIYRLIDI